MRTTMTKLGAALLIIGAVWLTATAARADVKSCLATAKATFSGCKTGCKNAFLDDRANCKGITPGCLSDCIDQRTTCLDNADATLNSCLASCQPTIDTGKATCRDAQHCNCGGPSNPCGFNQCYIDCLDPYEQVAFSCRDSCRNTFQLGGGPAAEAACRSAFKDCIAAPECQAQ